ncbi:MAG: hypothetical protein M3306_23780 [Actinomycetota bacterium]|nr:hypothetical protein [Actinomycetota bacterium]
MFVEMFATRYYRFIVLNPEARVDVPVQTGRRDDFGSFLSGEERLVYAHSKDDPRAAPYFL